ncbi:hypothetical protein KC960_05035 [Candidatus Saccharibacteria bacterium]|nr:hypothetical protein [Candidatus Saccharibacteria bacterium]
MKQCTKCKKIQKEIDFNKNNRYKDNISNICKICSRKKSRAYYNKNKEYHKQQTKINKIRYKKQVQDWIVNYLLKNPCQSCGNRDIRTLEFDHLDEFKKEFNISDGINRNLSLPRIQMEVRKCRVLCANCHNIHTQIRGNFYKHLGWIDFLNNK